jgi:hypothetical protein
MNDKWRPGIQDWDSIFEIGRKDINEVSKVVNRYIHKKSR